VVAVGDRWGALVTGLAEFGPTQISDSHLGRQATLANLRRNAPDARVRLLSTRDDPPPRVDVLLVRVPKSLALLEDQLHRLAPAVHAGTVVVGAGMVSEVHTSTLRLFERILGPTRTSLAVRKARLILCTPDPDLAPGPSPWPLRYALPDGIGAMSGRTVTNHAGVFCADRLDIGTRFLLEHLPERVGPDRVVDLGCGTGAGTLALLARFPDAEVTAVDFSPAHLNRLREKAAERGVAGRVRTVRADLDAGWPDLGRPDLVWASASLHHMADPDRTLQRIRDVLAS
ncbi:methyltransferase domain-containing protein, partial [Actinacidiphila rubida]|uniref:methyltransferase domain-containing protein n=1 Tax=Actinacidiphila rubida TaxID=310780 RepID=UPI000A58A0C3